MKRYKIKKASLCRTCQRFGTCTKSTRGRRIWRSLHEDLSQAILNKMQSVEFEKIYKLRAQKVEHPFGFMRRILGVRTFVLKGLNGAKAEMSLFASAFNIRRMITLLGGVEQFIAAVQA